jgi:hypothetical protein
VGLTDLVHSLSVLHSILPLTQVQLVQGAKLHLSWSWYNRPFWRQLSCPTGLTGVGLVGCKMCTSTVPVGVAEDVGRSLSG